MFETKDTELLCDTSNLEPFKSPIRSDLSTGSVNSLKNTSKIVSQKRKAYNILEIVIEKVSLFKTISEDNRATSIGLLIVFILLILIFGTGRQCCK